MTTTMTTTKRADRCKLRVSSCQRALCALGVTRIFTGSSHQQTSRRLVTEPSGAAGGGCLAKHRYFLKFGAAQTLLRVFEDKNMVLGVIKGKQALFSQNKMK